MDDQYASTIAGFPLFQGFTTQGTRRLMERGEIKEYVRREVIFKRVSCGNAKR
jgi:hypothetical protein